MAKRNQSHAYGDTSTDWLNLPCPFDSPTENLFKIVVFFVFHAPIKDVTARGGDMGRYKWGTIRGTNDFSYLKKEMQAIVDGNQKDWYCFAQNYGELNNGFYNTNIDDMLVDTKTEKAIYKKRYNCGEIESLLAHIRNCFAHGRISFIKDENNVIYLLEDIETKGENENKVTARFILRETTLLKWIKIIKDGPRPKDLK